MKDSFWNDFFAVIGIKRRVEAIYEEPVKTLSGKFGHIDVFWESKPLAVYKSVRSELMKKTRREAFASRRVRNDPTEIR